MMDEYLHRTGSPSPAYRYTALVVSVHDGDTIKVDIDLGFRTWIRQQDVRLFGCNAQELAKPGGPEAHENLATMLPPGTTIVLTSIIPDKYGNRVDAVITLLDGSDLVGTLIAEQWAALWNGLGPKPVPPWPRTVA